MAFLELRCSKCGGTLKEKGNVFECGYCHTTYLNDQIEKETAALRAILDEQKQEQLANRRHMLWEAIHAEYIDSEMIVDLCRSLRKLKPDDFEARFFEVANSGNGRELNRFIDSIDVKNPEEKFWAEEVVKFTIKSLRAENILSLNDLIERAYKDTDLEKYEKYATHVSDEAKKVEGGIYEPSLPRDVFVMYSSKDFKKVKELVYHLEESGLKCFVAMRNLQHGRGAVANYQRALETAMDNCKVIVFLSSRNSRALDCDAMRVEMPYLKRKDIENAPYEYRQHYDKMPQKYKKPRVEYRLDNEKTGGAGLVKEFFGELEFAYSADEVLNRVVQALTASVEEKPQEKYCVACGAKNALTAKFCNECGGKEFVSSKAELEAARLKKERAAHEEAEKKAAEAEREKQALLERLKALEAEKEEEKARKAQESETERKRKEEAELAAKLAREEEAKRRDEEARKRAEEAEKANQALLERLKKLEEAQRAPQPIVQNAAPMSQTNEDFLNVPEWEKTYANRSADDLFKEGMDYYQKSNPQKAVPLLTVAAKKGSGVAMFTLGYCYADTKYEGKDANKEKLCFVKSIPLLKQAAEKGDLLAAEDLGSVYDFGKGVAIDKTEAQKWYKLAKDGYEALANRGDKEGQYRLGRCYYFGNGVSKNYPTALTWYEKAAANGHGEAQEEIGTMYTFGYGVSANYPKAFAAYKKSAEMGYDMGKYSLAECYFEGKGTQKNYALAEKYYAEVVQEGHEWVRGRWEAAQKKVEEERQTEEAKRKAEEERKRAEEERRKAEIAKNFKIENGVLKEYTGTAGGDVVIPDGVTSIGENAFLGNITLMGYTKGVTSVTIPNGVTSIGEAAFSGCEELKRVVIPNTVKSIGQLAFNNCRALVDVTIPNSVTDIGVDAFSNCSALTSITVPSGVTSIQRHAFDGCRNLTNVTIQNGVKSIENMAFWECGRLTTITLPSTLKNIGTQAFYGCNNLEKVIIPNGVTSIETCAFQLCKNLELVTIPNSVTSMGERVFLDCDWLTICCQAKAKPSGWDNTWNPNNRPVYWNATEETYKRRIAEEEKRRAEIAKNFEIKNGLLVEYFGDAKEVVIPDEVVKIGENAFKNCREVTKVTVPNGVTDIDEGAFSFCENLTSITLPDSLETIGKDAFALCMHLSQVKIPNGVGFIGINAFRGCSNLQKIIIPNSVQTIGVGAFQGCGKLTIYAEAEKKPKDWVHQFFGANSYNPDKRPVVWGYKK